MLRSHRDTTLFASLALALALTLGLLPGCAPAPEPAQQAIETESHAAATDDQRPQSVRPRPIEDTTRLDTITHEAASIAEAPAFADEPGVYLNGNLPTFTAEDLAVPYGTEEYGALDALGRCTLAFALAGPETEPTSKRGDISHIHPSGWVQAHYPEQGIDHLFERSHLIAHCLTAEDANERNLIAGTNHMNQGAMQALEQKMDMLIGSTDEHVLIRVTPDFHGNELVARGVQMEAYSLEDAGEAICFNIYLYNVQPGVEIDYTTGQSRLAGELANTGADAVEAAPSETAAPAAAPEPEAVPAANEQPAPEAVATHSYVLNTNSHKFHYPDCASVSRMKEHNKSYVDATRDEVIARGYSPCGNCLP